MTPEELRKIVREEAQNAARAFAGPTLSQITDAVVDRLDSDPPQGIIDGVYKKLDENALSTIRSDISDLSESIESMAEDVAKISLIEAEVRHINKKLEDRSQ